MSWAEWGRVRQERILHIVIVNELGGPIKISGEKQYYWVIVDSGIQWIFCLVLTIILDTTTVSVIVLPKIFSASTKDTSFIFIVPTLNIITGVFLLVLKILGTSAKHKWPKWWERKDTSYDTVHVCWSTFFKRSGLIVRPPEQILTRHTVVLCVFSSVHKTSRSWI